MSLNNDRWGQAVADAIQSAGITDSSPITVGQLAVVWKAIKAQDITELGNADVASGSFANTAGAVTGTGGGIS